MKKPTSVLLAIAALALAACGDDESGEESEAAAVTPQVAIEEIAEVRAGLDEAATAYADGDAEAEQVVYSVTGEVVVRESTPPRAP